MQSCGEDGAICNFHPACEGESTVLPLDCSFPYLPALLTVMVQVSNNIKISHFTVLFFNLPLKGMLEEGLG